MSSKAATFLIDLQRGILDNRRAALLVLLCEAGYTFLCEYGTTCVQGMIRIIQIEI